MFAFSGPHWLIHRSFTPYIPNASELTWSDWELLSVANFADDPAVVSWGNGRLDVLARGLDGNQLFDKVYDHGWRNWEDLGGTLTSGPAAASWQPGQFVVFARNQAGGLSARGYWGTWFGWSDLDGNFVGAPSVTTWAFNTYSWDVFALSPQNTLLHKWYNGGVWTGWEDLGGAISSSPSTIVANF